MNRNSQRDYRLGRQPTPQSGARQIVAHCLGLQSGQQLLIFIDETTVEVGLALAEAAEELTVPNTTILTPVSIQRHIPLRSDLSLLAQGAAREARGILVCTNGEADCLPFRRKMLETHWTARARLGHMPGASLEALRLADVDYERLSAECRRVEAAMARGKRLELTSYAADGRPHHLTMELGSWERLPVASDGLIGDGAWGNIPPGETYIAPQEGSAEGSLVVNGSLPGRVIEAGDELLMTFIEGRLRRVEPSNSPAARWLEETQFRHAQAAGDSNWTCLAEIGVGLNPAVSKLTGNMLYDEKAAGTAHIALGSNLMMGGKNAAAIHCDLLTRRPSLSIDGKPVLERGSLVVDELDWFENYNAIPLEASPLRSASRISRSGVQAGWSNDGRLQRILRPETGRVSSIFVGDRETAQLAHSLYGLIPEMGEWMAIRELEALDTGGAEIIRRLLHVLWSYDLVRYR